MPAQREGRAGPRLVDAGFCRGLLANQAVYSSLWGNAAFPVIVADGFVAAPRSPTAAAQPRSPTKPTSSYWPLEHAPRAWRAPASTRSPRANSE